MTIGILTTHIGGALRPYERAISRAVSQVAKEQDLNVIFYSGGFDSLDSGARNYIFDQVLSDKPDGLLAISSILGIVDGSDLLMNYLSRFKEIPIVSAGMIIPGISSVHIHNYQAMAEIVTHMIDKHKSQKFVYINGPEENAESCQRLQAFKDVLKEHSIPEENYRVLPGDFFMPSGRKAAENVLKSGNMDFDTVISASDEMALGFIKTMEQNGIYCPEAYRITGYDYIEAAEYSTPFLTTMNQDVHLLGRTSMELLLQQMNKEEIPPVTWLPTQFIEGETCGCSRILHRCPAQATAEMSPEDTRFLKSQKLNLKTAIENQIDYSVVDEIIHEVIKRDLSPIVIIPQLMKIEKEIAAKGFSENYWQTYAYVMKSFRNWKGKNAMILDHREGQIHMISQQLLNTKSMEELTEIMNREFPDLEILSCALCFIPENKSHDHLDLKIHYSREEGAEFYPEAQKYATTNLLSDHSKRFRIVESLDFHGKILGLLIFESDTIHYSLFGPLRELFSGTLNHIQSFEKINHINSNLRTQVKRLNSLRTIDKSIVDHQSREELLQVLLQQVKEQQQVDAVSLLLFDEKKEILEFSACLGTNSSGLKRSRLKLGEGNAGSAGKLKKQIIIEDIRHSQDFIEFSLFQKENFIGYCAAPLVAHGQLKGVMELFHRAPLKRDRDWFQFLEALTGQAAIALENTFLLSDLQKVNEELLQAYRSTIEGWSRALDLRDHETEGHCMRVAQMSVEIGRKLKMAPQELEALYRGALLHDIGKMGIPDSILLKPGPLTDEERAIMNYHPQYAYELLAPIDFLQPALSVPWGHHERWDGGGYPRGLSGEEIPLNARIFTLIDVWDALTNDRPYQKAWSDNKARDYIRSQAGKQFDPDLIEPFFEMIDHSSEWLKSIPAPIHRLSSED